MLTGVLARHFRLQETTYLKPFCHHRLSLSEEGIITSSILHRLQESNLELFDIPRTKQALLDVLSEMENHPQGKTG